MRVHPRFVRRTCARRLPSPDPCGTHNSRDERAKLCDCKTTCMLLMSAQVPCSAPMDACPADLGIHGHNGDKNRVYSICCHGCPDSRKMGIHDGKATVSPSVLPGPDSAQLANREWITWTQAHPRQAGARIFDSCPDTANTPPTGTSRDSRMVGSCAATTLMPRSYRSTPALPWRFQVCSPS